MDLSGDAYLAIKAVMMPRDTNSHGTIFGGVILSYIDQAGAVGAAHAVRDRGWARPTLVTVAMDGVEFHEPVHVGDTVSFITRPVRFGRTSITVHVDVWAERCGRRLQVTEAHVTYVSVTEEGNRRTPVPLDRPPDAP